jgi:hypothetical protein
MIIDINEESIIIPDPLIMILLLLLHQPDSVSHLLCKPLHFLPCLLYALIYLLLNFAHVHTIELLISVDFDFRGHFLHPLLTLLHQHLLLLHDLLSDSDGTAPVLLSLHLIRQLLLPLPQLLQVLHLLIKIPIQTVNFGQALLGCRLLRELLLQLVHFHAHRDDLPHEHVVVGRLLTLRDLHRLRRLLERKDILELGLDSVSQRLDL